MGTAASTPFFISSAQSERTISVLSAIIAPSFSISEILATILVNRNIIDEEETLKLEKKLHKQDFTLQDYLDQLKQVKKLPKQLRNKCLFVNTNKMDKIYALGTPEFEKDTVIIRASQQTIDRISSVNALIDVSNVSGDIVAEAPLVAYNNDGSLSEEMRRITEKYRKEN